MCDNDQYWYNAFKELAESHVKQGKEILNLRSKLDTRHGVIDVKNETIEKQQKEIELLSSGGALGRKQVLILNLTNIINELRHDNDLITSCLKDVLKYSGQHLTIQMEERIKKLTEEK